MSRFPQVGDKYLHHKGQIYTIDGVASPLTVEIASSKILYARHTEGLYIVPVLVDYAGNMFVQGLNPMVIYHPDDKEVRGNLWARELGMFLDTKEHAGQIVFRFKKIHT